MSVSSERWNFSKNFIFCIEICTYERARGNRQMHTAETLQTNKTVLFVYCTMEVHILSLLILVNKVKKICQQIGSKLQTNCCFFADKCRFSIVLSMNSVLPTFIYIIKSQNHSIYIYIHINIHMRKKIANVKDFLGLLCVSLYVCLM